MSDRRPGHHRSAWLVAAWTAAGLTGAAPAPAQPDDIGVGVELILAVDISRSMSHDEQIIQRRGYAGAFRSAEVQGAILDGGWGRIAVAYVEWGGPYSQSVLIPWTLIDSRSAAAEFADTIETAPMTSVSRTSISGAIDFAVPLFEGNGFAGFRRIIDISGDGPNNAGRGVADARNDAVAGGVTINGLPLMTSDGPYGNWAGIPDLDRYYADCVIGGPGAFSIPVDSWDQFAAAVRQKLVLEIAGRPPAEEPRIIRAQASAGLPDCLVGERMWEERRRNWGP